MSASNGSGVGSRRDKMRAAIFATRERQRRLVNFFGEDIEIRQPSLEDILGAREDADEGNMATGVIKTLLKYAFIPGTDERVFEDTDADQLLALPFGADFTRVSRALEELTEVNFGNASSGSGQTAEKELSTE